MPIILLNGGHDVGGMDTVEAGRPVRGFGRHQQRISGKKPAGEKEAYRSFRVLKSL